MGGTCSCIRASNARKIDKMMEKETANHLRSIDLVMFGEQSSGTSGTSEMTKRWPQSRGATKPDINATIIWIRWNTVKGIRVLMHLCETWSIEHPGLLDKGKTDKLEKDLKLMREARSDIAHVDRDFFVQCGMSLDHQILDDIDVDIDVDVDIKEHDPIAQRALTKVSGRIQTIWKLSCIEETHRISKQIGAIEHDLGHFLDKIDKVMAHDYQPSWFDRHLIQPKTGQLGIEEFEYHPPEMKYKF